MTNIQEEVRVESLPNKPPRPGNLTGQTAITLQTIQAQKFIHGRERNDNKNIYPIMGLLGFAKRARLIKD